MQCMQAWVDVTLIVVPTCSGASQLQAVCRLSAATWVAVHAFIWRTLPVHVLFGWRRSRGCEAWTVIAGDLAACMFHCMLVRSKHHTTTADVFIREQRLFTTWSAGLMTGLPVEHPTMQTRWQCSYGGYLALPACQIGCNAQ
jgi:hypothetical protein